MASLTPDEQDDFIERAPDVFIAGGRRLGSRRLDDDRAGEGR